MNYKPLRKIEIHESISVREERKGEKEGGKKEGKKDQNTYRYTFNKLNKITKIDTH